MIDRIDDIFQSMEDAGRTLDALVGFKKQATDRGFHESWVDAMLLISLQNTTAETNLETARLQFETAKIQARKSGWFR